MSDQYKLYGMLMSPFSMKLRAYFRYRRLPFQWCNDMSAHEVAQTKVETYMVPVVQYPDSTYENDSTPIMNKLEDRLLNAAPTLKMKPMPFLLI